MVDFKAEARNVQDEPGASGHATNKEVLKIINGHSRRHSNQLKTASTVQSLDNLNSKIIKDNNES